MKLCNKIIKGAINRVEKKKMKKTNIVNDLQSLIIHIKVTD